MAAIAGSDDGVRHAPNAAAKSSNDRRPRDDRIIVSETVVDGISHPTIGGGSA